WKGLLRLELQEERRQFVRRIKSTPDIVLVRQGLALLDLSAMRVYIDEAGSGGTIAVLEAQQPFPPNHDFGPGDFVLIRESTRARSKGLRWVGTVVSIGRQGMQVELCDGEGGLDGFENSDNDDSDEDDDIDSDDSNVGDNSDGDHDDDSFGATAEADLLCDGLPVRVDKAFNMVSYMRQRQALEVLASAYNNTPDNKSDTDNKEGDVAAHVHGYNSTQQTSIATALSHRLALIHGPPGTGKTITTAGLVSFVKQGLTKKFESPVLVCGQSNTAVDKLVEDLVAIGLKVVRLGNPTRVNPQALHVTLFEHTKRHPRYKELEDLIKRAALLVVAESEVVCCTCIGAGGPELEGFSFPLLVLDEGSQASEPEALVPIMKGTHQVIIVGDHKQLPPTILSQEAAEQGLGVSLFERMMEAGVPSTLLGVQYRAHPLLFEFPSARFYSGAVQSGVKPDDRPQLTPPFPPGKGAAGHPPLVFLHDGGSKEEPGDSGKSYKNKSQAAMVTRIATSLVTNHGMQPSSIGCISFYAAQVASVDGFQGQEKDVIVISTVRSNAGGNIGFLRDPRRLNVAITRAKRLLVVVGNKATLAAGGCPHWEAWMEYLENKGWVRPVPKLKQ
ncbi:P-loop containing nucleoside triphosphate hydrolase protein, partial [Haematococcus lacustris]